MNRSRYESRVALAVAMILLPLMACAQASAWLAAATLPVVEKIEQIGPHRFQGLPLGASGGVEWGKGAFDWRLRLAFGIGKLGRAGESVPLRAEYRDPDTGELVSESRSADTPFRIKAILGLDFLA
ncbi:MAG: hypothetical protein Q8M76_01075, partial [Spirochaetaceae bacterium]|nr:hypothetical protein [Spirochaetaceae bacterium]